MVAISKSARLRFTLGGKSADAPIEWDDIELVANFDDEDIDDAVQGDITTQEFTFTNDDVTRKLGYIGTKRYTRLKIIPAANSGAALLSAVAILGWPSVAATANPPA